jgi:hypothetical protein
VKTASAWQIETLNWVARHADRVRQTVASCARPPERVAVRYRLEPGGDVDVETRSPRTLDGAPVTLRLPYWSSFVGTVVVDRPPAYLVPPGVADHLRRHGLDVSTVEGAHETEVARITGEAREGGRAILEAAEVGHLRAEWRSETFVAPRGWAKVSTDQPLGAIAVYLCEPESDDGAVENGLVPAPADGEDYPIRRLLG